VNQSEEDQMKIAYTSTALALMFGLGMAMTSLPAQAQQQEGGVTAGEGDPSGAVHPMEAHPARPDIVAQCDTTGDGFVSVEEARVCYEQHYGFISGGMDHITFREFAVGLREGEDAEALWAEIPREREDVMTREEWMAWRDREFAAAAPEGRMAADEFERQFAGGTATAAGIELSPSALEEVQRRLNDGGYDAGAVDGIWGPNTSQAVARFQRDEGLDPTGTLTLETIHALDLEELITGEGAAQPVAGTERADEPEERTGQQ
jgi:hypothetical protein